MQTKINKAIEELDRNMGYMYDLLLAINVAPIAHKYCETAMACVDNQGRRHIFISDQLIKEFEDFELQLVIYHETMHIVYDHLAIGTPLAKKFATNHDLANVAQDCIINEVIGLLPKNVNHPVLKMGVTPQYVSSIVGQHISAKTHSVEEVFDLLLIAEEEGKLPENLKNFDSGVSEVGILPDDLKNAIQDIIGEPSEGTTADGEGEKGDGQESEINSGNSDEAPDEETEELGSNRDGDCDHQDDILEQVGNGYCKSGSSKDGPYFSGQLEQIRVNRKITSRIGRILKQVKISKRNTTKRPSRRFAGNPLGRIKNVGQKVLIGVDVSGSMDTALLQGNVARAIHGCMATDIELDIVWGDTRELGREYNINKKFPLKKIRGGGGTMLDFMFKGLEDYSAFICITDGDFNHSFLSQKQKDRTLFLIVPEWGFTPIEGATNINALTGDDLVKQENGSWR